MYAADETVIDELLIAGLQASRPKSLTRQACERLIERLATEGLIAEQIRRVLRHREWT